MKKALLFIVAGGLFSLHLMAQEGIPVHHNVNASLTEESFTIDGVGDEAAWELTDAIPIENHWVWDATLETEVWQAELPDAADFSASFKVLHDGSALFFYCDVKDDILIKHVDHSDLDPWMVDEMEIFVHFRYEKLDTTVNGSAGMRATSYQLLLNHGNPAGSDVFMNNGWDPGSPEDIAKIEWASVPTAEGYSIEVKIPFTLWEDDVMEDGTAVPITAMDSIGFEVSMVDADEETGGGPVLAWNCGETADGLKISWKPNYWGKLTFLGAEEPPAGDENYILNGDMEEQGVWQIIANDGDLSDVSWEFGTLQQAPLEGDEGCLRVSFSDMSTPLNQMLYQKVMLTIGDTYQFSGAFKDAGTNADVDQIWHQIIIWPTIEDDDLSDGLTGGPHWTDNDAIILLNHAKGWGVDWLGIGANTTYEDDMNPDAIYGNRVGLGDGDGQGDTTIYTVPEAMFRQTDTLVLGAIGDEIEYYVILQVGQWMEEGSSIVNSFDFTFDELKLMGPSKGTSVKERVFSSDLQVYPNPVNDILNVKNSCRISTVSVRNILGQEVMRVNNIGIDHARINTSELTTGMYILSVTDEFGKIYSSKVLKR